MLVEYKQQTDQRLEEAPYQVAAAIYCSGGVFSGTPRHKTYWDAWRSKIICTDDGNSYTADKFRREFYYPALATIGIRRLSPHAPRHTFATKFSAAGARSEDIQTLAGHDDYEVTANTYIHRDINALRAAIERLS